MDTATLRQLTPEMTLAAAAAAIYLGGAFFLSKRIWTWTAGAALAAAALTMQPSGDPLADNFRWLALAGGALLVLLTSRTAEPEYIATLLLASAGLMLTAAARDLILLFVALELVSIPTYILLYLGRRDADGQESAIKYFFLSVLSSAVFLYGLSFLYGAAGSMEFSALAGAARSGFGGLVRLGLVLVLSGLGFKIAAVPFHFYAPDVYQGNSHAGGALLSVVPKAAGLVALVRIFCLAAPEASFFLWQMVWTLSILSMTLGNVLALWQNDLRRMLGYSSIAQTGYLLIGLCVGLASGAAPSPWDGLAALRFYFLAYAAAAIGTFAVLEYLGKIDRRIDGVEELAGLGQTRPGAAAMLAVCLFSLTGVPPAAGFWGKLLLFGSALGVGGEARRWFIALAVVGVLNAAVAAAYYLRLVAVMYFRTPLATPRAQGGRGAWWAAMVCSLFLVAAGLWPAPWIAATTDCRTHAIKKAATPVCPEAWRGGAPSDSHFPSALLLSRVGVTTGCHAELK